MVWLTGSLNGRSWDHVRPLVVAVATLVPVALLLARHLRTLDMGDDAAAGPGTPVEPVRAGLLLSGVALAVAVSSAGPIAFVALVSPQIAPPARRRRRRRPAAQRRARLPDHPDGPGDGDRRRQRLRQVDAAAEPGPSARAPPRLGAAR
jgi:FecCD transport family